MGLLRFVQIPDMVTVWKYTSQSFPMRLASASTSSNVFSGFACRGKCNKVAMPDW